MHNPRTRFQFSFLSIVSGAVGFLLVVYIGLIAVIMSYASMTVESAQRVKEDKSAVAVLESKYLSAITDITNIDYAASGYTQPIAKIFVAGKSPTALR